MFKRLILVNLFLLVCLMVISCSKEPEPLESITIGTPRSILTSLIWVADQKGFFKEQGLEVSLKEFVSGKRALNAYLKKQLDLVVTAEAPFVLAAFKHPELRLFASLGSSDNEVRLVARRDRQINNIADLKGKRIATQKGSAVHFFMDSFLLYHRIRDYTPVFLKGEQLPKVLFNGEIDAFAMREPYIQRAKELLGSNIIEFSQAGLYTKSYNLVGSSAFSKQHPEYLKRILAALVRAETFCRENPKDAVKLIADLHKLPPQRVEDIWDDMVLAVSLTQSLLLTLEEEAQWAQRTQLVQSQEKNNMLSFMEPLFLSEVKPTAVGIFSTTR